MDFLWTISEWRTPVLSALFGGITLFGEDTFAIIILCTIYWCINKKLAYDIGCSFCLTGLLIQGLKITFRIERPWVLDPGFHPVYSAVKSATGYSFPSGHTQCASALYGALALNTRNRRLRMLCSFLILGVGFSRMYLGVHTMKDVLVSAAISLSIVFVYQTYVVKKVLAEMWSVLIVFVAVCLLIYASFLLKIQMVPLNHISGCFKSVGAAIGFGIGFLIEKKYIGFDTKTDKKYQQLIKLIVGLYLTVFIKMGLKEILWESMLANTCRYFFVVLWIMAIYPVLFMKLSLGYQKIRKR